MSMRKKILSRRQVSISGEAVYIIGRALERDARVVTLGGIVFFSTDSGDAWMLDSEDGLASCLARDGVKQDYLILETGSNFQIQWDARYEIQDDAFTIATAAGRISTIIGCPVKEIVKAIHRSKRVH